MQTSKITRQKQRQPNTWSCIPSRGRYSPKAALSFVKLAPCSKAPCHQSCKTILQSAPNMHIGLKYINKAEVDRLAADESWEPFPSQHHVQRAWKHFSPRNRLFRCLDSLCRLKRSVDGYFSREDKRKLLQSRYCIGRKGDKRTLKQGKDNSSKPE